MSSRNPSLETGGVLNQPSLSAVLEANPDAQALLSAVRDAEGTAMDFRLLAANTSYCRHLGLPQEEVVGHLLTVVQPRTDPQRIAEYARVLATGEPVTRSTRSGEREAPVVECRRVDQETLSLVIRAEGRTPQQGGEFELRSLTDSSPIGLALVAADGSFLRVNHALCELLGRDEESLKSSTWQNLTHPDDLDVDQRLVDEVLAGDRDGYRIEKRYLRPDGSVVWGDLSVVCVRRRDGGVDYFISQIVDVTHRREIEHELAASREGYRLLAENASDLVFRSDAALRLRWLAPAVETLLGWRPDELVGTSVRDLVNPEDGPAMARAAADSAAGQPVSYRARFRCKDGGWKWLMITARPIFENGELVGRIGSGRDIDAEQAALEALAAQHAYVNAVLESELDPRVRVVPVRDRAGVTTDLRYTDANPAALDQLGLAADQLRGAQMLVLFPAQRAVGLFDAYLHTLETGEPLVVDDLKVTNDVAGDARWIDLRAVKVDDALSITWRDVTDRRAAQERLEQSEARFRLLADNSADTVMLASQGNMLWLSPSLWRLLGYEPDEWVGRSLEEFTHPDDVELARSLRHELNDGQSRFTRLRLLNEEGEYRWVDIHSAPLSDGSGGGIVASLRDADALVRAEQELARSEQRFRLIATNTSDILGLGDAEGYLQWVSPSLTAALGWLPEQWIGHRAVEFTHPDDRKLLREWRGEVMGGVAGSIRLRVVDSSGMYHWAESRASAFLDDTGEVQGIVSAITIIDGQVAWEDSLRRQASYDELTGLLTRDELYRRAQTLRHAGARNYVAFVDVDNLKLVNDTVGHTAGDELLRVVARRIREMLRETDLIARVGGDEILIVLRGVGDMDAAVRLMDRLLAAAGEPHSLTDGTVLRPRVSIGLTEIGPAEDLEDVVGRADAAMYEAKSAGGHQVRLSR